MVDLIRKLDELAVDASVSRGSVLFLSGTPASAAFVVRSGRVVLLSETTPNQVYPMCVHGPGSLLGLASALNGQYTATAKAVEDCDLGYIPADRLVALLDSSALLTVETTRLTEAESARLRSTAGATASNPSAPGKAGRSS
jgi:CRP-like cAMP-binding protein